MRIDEVFMFVVKDPHDKIFIDKVILEKITGLGTIPILWCRDGNYCLIPKEVVKNAIELSELPPPTKRTIPKLFFAWDQGISMSNAAGRALLGE